MRTDKLTSGEGRESHDLQLPYSFDLHFNIKNKEQLVTEYVNLKNRIQNMEEVCKAHNIDINALSRKQKTNSKSGMWKDCK